MKLAYRCITETSLYVGDILLSTTDDLISKTVRRATQSEFSHARIYIGNGEMIEAVNPKVKEDLLSDVVKKDLYTLVYRLPGLTRQQQQQIVHYARLQEYLKKEYDLSGALTSLPTWQVALATGASGLIAKYDNDKDPEHDFYCSELVAFAYQYAGIEMGWNPSQTTPQDIVTNRKLQYIGHLMY